jgi:uncharacterized protein YdeI (YjbR/CyaY-like superfamily)
VGVELIELTVKDRAAWRRWLEKNHRASPGVWLTLAKKAKPGPTTLTYDEALEESLCFGWIDGQRGAGDGSTVRQRFTHRGPRSRWSARNLGIVDRLQAEGRMEPQGEAEVARAQADGRWAGAYAGPATSVVPAELAAALRATRRRRRCSRFSPRRIGTPSTIEWRLHGGLRRGPRTSRSSSPCSLAGRPSIPRNVRSRIDRISEEWSGRRDSNSRPLPGKVPLQFWIQQGAKTASKRFLALNFHGLKANHTGSTPTTSASTPVRNREIPVGEGKRCLNLPRQRCVQLRLSDQRRRLGPNALVQPRTAARGDRLDARSDRKSFRTGRDQTARGGAAVRTTICI